MMHRSPTPSSRCRLGRRFGVLLATAAVAVTAISVGSGSQAAPNGVAGGASADDLAIRTELPANPHRPQVYLAYHGSEGLLGNNDHQWPFVRQHLDGVWGNPFSPAGVGTDGSLNRTIELTSKLRTRKLIVEHPIANGAGCEGFRDDWYWAEVERRSNIRYDRVAAAVYAGQNPDCWGPAGGITAGFDTYRRQGYDTVYTLFQPQNLSTQVNAGAFPTIRPGSAGDVAYRNSGGVVLECPIDACTDPTFGAPFFQAIQEAHARNVPFVWFTGFSTSYGIGRSGWLQRVQHQYNAVAAMGLWRPDDAIVLINYDGYRALPERNADGSPADTTAGILAWLLEQRPVQTLCPDRVSC